ncbi:MAG: hypothetical protein VX397_04635 [Pseudomonadota bacterium]|nr:hypothetical protein [Pseudomonadota bacterium]
MIKKTLLIILMAIITTILFILFTDINNNLILNWGDWEVLTSLTALVLIFLTYTLLLVLLIYLYSSLIRVKEKRILSKKIKNLSNSIDILNDLSFDISKNQLDKSDEKIRKLRTHLGNREIVSLIEEIVDYRKSEAE